MAQAPNLPTIITAVAGQKAKASEYNTNNTNILGTFNGNLTAGNLTTFTSDIIWNISSGDSALTVTNSSPAAGDIADFTMSGVLAANKAMINLTLAGAQISSGASALAIDSSNASSTNPLVRLTVPSQLLNAIELHSTTDSAFLSIIKSSVPQFDLRQTGTDIIYNTASAVDHVFQNLSTDKFRISSTKALADTLEGVFDILRVGTATGPTWARVSDTESTFANNVNIAGSLSFGTGTQPILSQVDATSNLLVQSILKFSSSTGGAILSGGTNIIRVDQKLTIHDGSDDRTAVVSQFNSTGPTRIIQEGTFSGTTDGAGLLNFTGGTAIVFSEAFGASPVTVMITEVGTNETQRYAVTATTTTTFDASITTTVAVRAFTMKYLAFGERA